MLREFWLCLFQHHVMFVSGPLQVHVGTSHQEQRVVGYLTCTHLHAIEGTVTCSTDVQTLLPFFCLSHSFPVSQTHFLRAGWVMVSFYNSKTTTTIQPHTQPCVYVCVFVCPDSYINECIKTLVRLLLLFPWRLAQAV